MLTLCDGDCGLGAMTMMLGAPRSFHARSELRLELNDYFPLRIGTPWMHDIMVACQELCQEDVILYRTGDLGVIAAPTAAAPAVADLAVETAEHKLVLRPDEETFVAMRLASQLDDDVGLDSFTAQ